MTLTELHAAVTELLTNHPELRNMELRDEAAGAVALWDRGARRST